MKRVMTFLGLLPFRSTGMTKSMALLLIAAYFLMACAKDSSPKATTPKGGSNNPQIATADQQKQQPQQQAPAVCRGTLPKNDLLEYDFGDRHFTFIGWTHNERAEQKRAVKYIFDMSTAAKARDCAKVEKIHADFARAMEHRTRESQRVFVALDVAYQNHAFASIGIEDSPSELGQVRKAKGNFIDDADRALQHITGVCKDFDGTDVHKVFPGPEFEYAKESNGLIEVTPLEDHELKLKYLAKVTDGVLEFDFKNSGLSTKALEFINNLSDSPSEQEERQLLATDSNPKNQERLKRLYEGRMAAYSSIGPRNQAMIQSLMKLKGNVAIVVGSAHIHDFKGQLDQLCEGSAEVPVSGL